MKKNLIDYKYIILENGGGSQPIVRAMLANTYLFAAIGYFIIAFILLLIREHSYFIILGIILIIIGIFCIRNYVLSITRIVIQDQNIIFVLPLNEVILSRNDIQLIKMHRMVIPNILTVKVYAREKGKKWIFNAIQYLKKEDLEFLKNSWLYDICTIKGKKVDPDAFDLWQGMR